MLIYILLIILSTIIFISHIYVKDEKVNFVTAFVWVLLMTLFVGSQDGIGTDHSNYIAVFSIIQFGSSDISLCHFLVWLNVNFLWEETLHSFCFGFSSALFCIVRDIDDCIS